MTRRFRDERVANRQAFRVLERDKHAGGGFDARLVDDAALTMARSSFAETCLLATGFHDCDVTIARH